ncbi:hypothetical protein [Alteromonas sp. H39]|uniref:hypothetical protein n=1 Tax=Alteromonas sp. H39 TaxID=3389876 RepID=UPI0039E1C626
MSKFTKVIKSTVAALALATSYNASADTVSAGGIEWDTFTQDGVEAMSAAFSFQQWFTNDYTSGGVIGGASASNAVLPQVGAELVGIGLFNEFSVARSLGSPDFCETGNSSNCELTFAFGGLIATSPTTFDFSNAWLNVYFDDTPDFPQSASGANLWQETADAQNGTLWASFSWDEFVFVAGNLNGGVISAALTVTGGLPSVVDALDYGQGQSDFSMLSSALFFTGNVRSTGGTGNMQSVSAPSTVALFGLSLIALGAASRRKKAK